MPHRCQMVGGLTVTSASTVIAELDIAASARAVLYLLVTTYGMSELVGLGPTLLR